MTLLATHEWLPETDAGAAAPVAVVVHGVELDSGHTVHRDRFDEYVATLVGWLGA